MSNDIRLGEVLESLRPNGEYAALEGKPLEWLDAVQTEPTQAEIDAETIRLQGIYDGNLYQRQRKAKYDALNQFELISDDSINGTTTHKDAIVAIKAAHPKP